MLEKWKAVLASPHDLGENEMSVCTWAQFRTQNVWYIKNDHTGSYPAQFHSIVSHVPAQLPMIHAALKYYKAIYAPTAARLSSSLCAQKWIYLDNGRCPVAAASPSPSATHLSAARVKPAAPSSFSPAAGNWSATGRRERALRRHLGAPRGSYSELGATRWNESVSTFFVK